MQGPRGPREAPGGLEELPGGLRELPGGLREPPGGPKTQKGPKWTRESVSKNGVSWLDLKKWRESIGFWNRMVKKTYEKLCFGHPLAP